MTERVGLGRCEEGDWRGDGQEELQEPRSSERRFADTEPAARAGGR